MTRLHQSIALWFGKKEHFFGRAIAVPIICGILLNICPNKDRGWNLDSWGFYDNLNLYIFLAVFVCWAIYLTWNTLGKTLYAGRGFR